MKKFLIAGSSLAAVAAAGSAGAVDVTLGGSIDMGVEFGIGKSSSDLSVGAAYNNISLSLAAAGTTDGGMKYGGSFTLGTASELELNPYDTNGTAAGGKKLVKMTASGATDIEAAAYNVSGGQAIAAGQIVGVKINSSWRSVGATVTGYDIDLGAVSASTICKVAGRATAVAFTVSRMTASGGASASSTAKMASSTAYMPAGHVIGGAATLTAGGAIVTPNGVDFDGAGTGDALAADVYAGPFMSVMLQSSSTKMVIGAVCVEGIAASSTNVFLNNASKVVTASDASIYIEGGFGKLTLQTGDYAGGVSAIGSAGDAADLEADGLVAVMAGVGLLGANPFIAVDLAPGSASTLSNLEVLTGGTIDMGGLSASVDVLLNTSDVMDISAWDLGLDYAMGDMSLAFAYDSGNDWGMSASMGIAGFSVDATFASDTASDHEKSGITYSVGASTSLNGFGLSIGVDQDMQPTVNLSKSMGGLSIYAGYDAADEGGKVGATLSF